MLLGVILMVLIFAKSVKTIKDYQRGHKDQKNLVLSLQIVLQVLILVIYLLMFTIEVLDFARQIETSGYLQKTYFALLIFFTLIQGVCMLLCLYTFNAFAAQQTPSRQQSTQINDPVLHQAHTSLNPDINRFD